VIVISSEEAHQGKSLTLVDVANSLSRLFGTEKKTTEVYTTLPMTPPKMASNENLERLLGNERSERQKELRPTQPNLPGSELLIMAYLQTLFLGSCARMYPHEPAFKSALRTIIRSSQEMEKPFSTGDIDALRKFVEHRYYAKVEELCAEVGDGMKG
jgi:hypothetical protein